MTHYEMRVAIAEACGWTPFSDAKNADFWFVPGEKCRELWRTRRVPDYPNDLNAMAVAEKTLTDDQWATYRDHLNEMAFQEIKDRKPLPRWNRRESCTATQRAEAFLRTLGLWKD